MSTEFRSFPNARETLEAGVREGVAPGFVAGVWSAHTPESMELFAVGNRRLRLKGFAAQPMAVDTVFDLASVTKVFATATLAALLVDRGWIRYEQKLKAFLPDFPWEAISVGNLLSHTSGMPAWMPLYQSIQERFHPDPLDIVSVSERQATMRELLTKIRPEAPADSRVVYSDIGFLLLGYALEEAVGMPLDQAVRRLVWEPMGLQSRFIRTDRAAFAGRIESVAATEDCLWRGTVLQGQVHDDNCWAMGGYGGHAGAFGSARDLILFSKALMGGFISPKTRRAMWTPVKRPFGSERTLGWDTPSGETPALGRKFSPSSVGHLGFTGTSLWIDYERGWVVTLLSNRVHPSRENNAIRGFRGRFHTALAGDLAL